MTRFVISAMAIIHLFVLVARANLTDPELFIEQFAAELEADPDYVDYVDEYAPTERRLFLFGNRRRVALRGDTDGADAVYTDPIDAASSIPTTSNYSTEFLASANDYNITNRVLDIFFNTQYCGPGSKNRQVDDRSIGHRFEVVGQADGEEFGADRSNDLGRVSYAELDMCCKQHDECPNYITEAGHYAQYPGLEYRNQYFTRLECKCDGMFYKCLSDLNSRYASAVAIAYGIIQSYCFEYEYPVVKCNKRGLRRCVEYVVDASKPKQWQWFNLPPAYKKIFEFPQTVQA